MSNNQNGDVISLVSVEIEVEESILQTSPTSLDVVEIHKSVQICNESMQHKVGHSQDVLVENDKLLVQGLIQNAAEHIKCKSLKIIFQGDQDRNRICDKCLLVTSPTSSELVEIDQSVQIYTESVEHKLGGCLDIPVETYQLVQGLVQHGGINLKTSLEIVCQADHDRNGRIDFREMMYMLFRKSNKKTLSFLHKYVGLFLIPKKNATGCNLKLVLIRKPDQYESYDRLVTFNMACLVLVVLTLLQVILFFAGGHYVRKWLKFKHYKKKQLWRFFTYVLVHNDKAHLLCNVIPQLAVGIPLAMAHCWRLLVVCAAGAFSGCYLHYLCTPTARLLGASPVVYAMITAHISKIILNYSEVTAAMPQLIVLSLFTVLNTIYNYSHSKEQDQEDKTSYESHLGGAIAGFLVGILILKNVNERPFEKVVWYSACCVSVALMVIGIIFQLI